ncbi:inducible alternative oxidase 2 [Irineochytrium annulatum]|nr:inducible alternative oxidase 2 [Irineochytrium annulatum]
MTFTLHDRACTAAGWARRLHLTECVAAAPPFAGALATHLRFMGTMHERRGLVETLLDEGEGRRERMRCWAEINKPGAIVRLGRALAQGLWYNVFLAMYSASPTLAHKVLAMQSERTVVTYTYLLRDLEREDPLDITTKGWRVHDPAPPSALAYWQLSEGATVRDTLLCMRRDEAFVCDRHHWLSQLKEGSTLHEGLDANGWALEDAKEDSEAVVATVKDKE